MPHVSTTPPCRRLRRSARSAIASSPSCSTGLFGEVLDIAVERLTREAPETGGLLAERDQLNRELGNLITIAAAGGADASTLVAEIKRREKAESGDRAGARPVRRSKRSSPSRSAYHAHARLTGRRCCATYSTGRSSLVCRKVARCRVKRNRTRGECSAGSCLQSCRPPTGHARK